MLNALTILSGAIHEEMKLIANKLSGFNESPSGNLISPDLRTLQSLCSFTGYWGLTNYIAEMADLAAAIEAYDIEKVDRAQHLDRVKVLAMSISVLGIHCKKTNTGSVASYTDLNDQFAKLIRKSRRGFLEMDPEEFRRLTFLATPPSLEVELRWVPPLKASRQGLVSALRQIVSSGTVNGDLLLSAAEVNPYPSLSGFLETLACIDEDIGKAGLKGSVLEELRRLLQLIEDGPWVYCPAPEPLLFSEVMFYLAHSNTDEVCARELRARYSLLASSLSNVPTVHDVAKRFSVAMGKLKSAFLQSALGGTPSAIATLAGEIEKSAGRLNNQSFSLLAEEFVSFTSDWGANRDVASEEWIYGANLVLLLQECAERSVDPDVQEEFLALTKKTIADKSFHICESMQLSNRVLAINKACICLRQDLKKLNKDIEDSVRSLRENEYTQKNAERLVEVLGPKAKEVLLITSGFLETVGLHRGTEFCVSVLDTILLPDTWMLKSGRDLVFDGMTRLHLLIERLRPGSMYDVQEEDLGEFGQIQVDEAGVFVDCDEVIASEDVEPNPKTEGSPLQIVAVEPLQEGSPLNESQPASETSQTHVEVAYDFPAPLVSSDGVATVPSLESNDVTLDSSAMADSRDTSNDASIPDAATNSKDAAGFDIAVVLDEPITTATDTLEAEPISIDPAVVDTNQVAPEQPDDYQPEVTEEAISIESQAFQIVGTEVAPVEIELAQDIQEIEEADASPGYSEMPINFGIDNEPLSPDSELKSNATNEGSAQNQKSPIQSVESEASVSDADRNSAEPVELTEKLLAEVVHIPVVDAEPQQDSLLSGESEVAVLVPIDAGSDDFRDGGHSPRYDLTAPDLINEDLAHNAVAEVQKIDATPNARGLDDPADLVGLFGPGLDEMPAESHFSFEGDSELVTPARDFVDPVKLLEGFLVVANDLKDVFSTDDEELIKVMVEESEQCIEDIASSLQLWHEAEGPEPLIGSVAEIRRHIHTLKGVARTCGLMAVGAILHAMEDDLDDMPDDGVCLSSYVGAFQSAMQEVSLRFKNASPKANQVAVVQAVKPQESGPLATVSKPLGIPANVSSTRGQTIRIPLAVANKVGISSNQVAISSKESLENFKKTIKLFRELEVAIRRTSPIIGELDNLAGASIASHSGRGASGFDALEMDRFTELQEIANRIKEGFVDIESFLNPIRESFVLFQNAEKDRTQLSEEMQKEASELMLLDLQGYGHRLEQTIDKACSDTSKMVTLKILRDTKIPAAAVDKLIPVFEHIVRNSVAHGLEDANIRLQRGKPLSGLITIGMRRDASLDGGLVQVSVKDDGAGIDYDKVLAIAIQRGLAFKDRRYSNSQIGEFLFSPGFSTASTVSQLAGRGVGLDVVRSSVASLGGMVSVSSELGKGAEFVLTIPADISSMSVLPVMVSGFKALIPLSLVTRVVPVSQNFNVTLELKNGIARIDEEVMDLIELSRRVPVKELTPFRGSGNLVLLRDAGGTKAVLVDSVGTQAKTVVRALGPYVRDIPGIVAGTIHENGEAALIVNPVHLQEITATFKRDDLASNSQKTIMIVDDSSTARLITSKFLKRLGYAVIQAKDGIEAISKLTDGADPEGFLFDLEMPGMDGFDLIVGVKAIERCINRPIIVISSRSGDKYRSRAKSLGASAYITKPYDESQLQSVLDELVGSNFEASVSS